MSYICKSVRSSLPASIPLFNALLGSTGIFPADGIDFPANVLEGETFELKVEFTNSLMASKPGFKLDFYSV